MGLRARGLTDEAVETAFTEGRILRTHVLRPTWHFVTPADIRWMLALTGPRLNRSHLPYHAQLGLDEKVLKRSRVAIERALRDGKQLTRAELGAVLGRAGVKVQGLGLAIVMMNAELDGVVCSGARKGKQFTYALLEERAPHAKPLTRDEALGELARRYFTSHGPATLRDYVWWSGLVVGDARRGIEIAGSALQHQVVDQRTYWSAASSRSAPRTAASAYLLPNYDEYLVAYRDRDEVVGLSKRAAAGPRGSDVFGHSVIIDGRLAGTWTRTAVRESVTVDVVSYRRLTPLERRAVSVAAGRYGRFMNQAVVCVHGSSR